jgi:hypothetical protein
MARTLRVVANPFVSLDHEGNPAGAFPVEGTPGAYIGAVPKHDIKPRSAAFLGRDITTAWEFQSDEVEVPDTPYYRGGIRDGALLPVDEYTAKKAGVEYRAPAEALEKSRSTAAERFRAMNEGEDPAFLVKHAAPRGDEGDR